MRGATVAITGASGFIGRHLCQRLLADGAAVVALVRRPDPMLAAAGCTMQVAADAAALEEALAETAPEFIFHLASGDYRRPAEGLADARAAIAGGPALFIDLLAAAAALPRPPRAVVRAASLAEYGPIATPYGEDMREEPADSHAAAALAATRFGAMLAPRLPFALASARLALVYGGGQSDRFLIPGMIRRLLAGHPVHVARPADRRDLLHVDDAVDGLIAVARAAAAAEAPPIVNICSGVAPAMGQVAREVARLLEAPPRLLSMGDAQAPGGTPLLLGCPDLAARSCGWRARIGWEEGLALTVAAETAGSRQAVLAC